MSPDCVPPAVDVPAEDEGQYGQRENAPAGSVSLPLRGAGPGVGLPLQRSGLQISAL